RSFFGRFYPDHYRIDLGSVHVAGLSMTKRARRRILQTLAAILMLVAVVDASTTTRLDPLLQQRSLSLTGQSRVIAIARDAASLPPLALLIRLLGGTLDRQLPIINGWAATVPNAVLTVLAGSPLVQHVALDRLAFGAMERTGATVGATVSRQLYGYDGS